MRFAEGQTLYDGWSVAQVCRIGSCRRSLLFADILDDAINATRLLEFIALIAKCGCARHEKQCFDIEDQDALSTMHRGLFLQPNIFLWGI